MSQHNFDENIASFLFFGLLVIVLAAFFHRRRFDLATNITQRLHLSKHLMRMGFVKAWRECLHDLVLESYELHDLLIRDYSHTFEYDSDWYVLYNLIC